MTEFNAGAAVGVYKLDTSQAEQAAARLKALFASVNQAAAGAGTAGGGGNTAAITARERALERLRDSEIRAARAGGEHQRALFLIDNQLRAASPNTARYNNLLAQHATVTQQAARATQSFGQEIGQSIKSNLLGILGPAALVTGAVSLATKTFESFAAALKFKGELDQNNASITVQLRGFRDTTQAFREADAFAKRYKLTQTETTSAIQESIPILRQSKQSLTDVVSTLLRLSILKPEQGIQGAAFALGELQGGQTRSLNTRFNIPIAKAHELEKEIQAGGDAVVVLGKYLDSVGVGMDALDVRTKGVAGAFNALKVQQEQFQLAQARFAEGPGLVILKAQTDATIGATQLLTGNLRNTDQGFRELNASGGVVGALFRILTGDMQRTADATAKLTNGSRGLGGVFDEERQAAQRATEAHAALTSDINKELSEKVNDQIETARLADQQRRLQADSVLAAQGLLGAGDQAVFLAQKYGIATDQAQFLINAQQQVAALAGLADQRKGEQGAPSDAAAKAARDKAARTRAADLANAPANRAALADQRGGERGDGGTVAAANAARAKLRRDEQEAARIAQARNALAFAGLKTDAQKIAFLERELAGTTDVLKRLDLQTQIQGLRNSSAKSHTTELGKQLKLEEGIYDSKQKQLDASLQAEELAIRNRQETRKEDQEQRINNNVLANARDPRFRAAAADANALIDVHRRQRLNELNKQNATAGGSIVNGRVLQSIQSGGGAGAPIPTAGGGGSGAPTGAVSAGPTATFILNFDGKTVGTVVLPYVIGALLEGHAQSSNSGGGRVSP